MASGKTTATESQEPSGSDGPGSSLTHTSCPVVSTEHQAPPEITAGSDSLGEAQQDSDAMCHFFLAGKCHFGPRCRLSHSSRGTGVSEQDGGEEEKHKKEQANALEPKHNKKTEVERRKKKPRMRTADDVISRILWDTPAEAEHFVVGYVDRFLGVLERPFSEFNWDTDPCDCDYTSELALPRHRIQYFVFRGQRVWDRNSRTDRVDGAPEEEATRGESLKDEWLESWEDHNKQNPSEDPDDTSPFQFFIPKQKEQKKQEQKQEQKEQHGGGGGGRPTKRRPTHFITFRANTPGILSGFQRLQEEVCTSLPSSTPHWMHSSTLHITMCLLVLPGPEEVAAAAEMLRRFAFLDRNPPVALTFPLRLKHFNGSVLYLSPQPQLPLQQLNSDLQEAFHRAGWLHRDSFNPRYHLTLAKVGWDWEGERRVFQRVGELRVGKGQNWGRLPVNTLHLCSMGVDETTGFYGIVCTVTLR
ncbi:hypothetical protein CRUP_027199 [Coryphaenoides rupestris]|nr:hypothetical protein CRUP_027199 [Coryphaenoides rupestris]